MAYELIHRNPRPWSRPQLSHWPDWYAQDIAREHGQLRWSVFAMHWSIIGWCATYDNSSKYIQTWMGRRQDTFR